jgi:hypothetical protein
VHGQNVPNEALDHVGLILDLLLLERDALILKELSGLDSLKSGELAVITLAPEGHFAVRNIINEKIVNDLPFFISFSLAQVKVETLPTSVVPGGHWNNLATSS